MWKKETYLVIAPKTESMNPWSPAITRRLGRVVALSLLGIVLTPGQTLTSNRTSDPIAQIVPLFVSDSGSQNVTDCLPNQCVDRAATEQRPNFFNLATYGCFCDEDCVVFGDCCSDAPWPVAAPIQTTCSRMPDRDSYIYMVSRCPSSWPHDTTRQACVSSDTSLSEDPLAALPVTSPRSGRTYRNPACARCHQDTAGAVLWSAIVRCPELPSRLAGNTTAATLQRNEDGEWGVLIVLDDVETFTRCNFELQLPRSLGDGYVRGCLPAVSDCAPDWTDREAAAECGAYTARVRDMNVTNGRAAEYGHVYRNPHCALCNGVPFDTLDCGSLDRFGRDGVLYDYPVRFSPGSLSFSALLDISDRSGSETVGVVEVCDGARFWDPFFHKCRDVFCDANHVLEGDLCVPVVGLPSANSTAEASRSRLCPKFYLSADEFETRPDGSVYVQLYDRLYVDGEFELQDGELAVCSQSSDFSKFNDTLGILSLMFVLASVICLCCHLVLFCLVPEQRNTPGKNLAALCVCLLLGYICFMAAQFQEPGTGGCRALGIVMYTAFIASFLWMNVMAVDVFISLRQAVTELRVTAGDRIKSFLLYSLYTLSVTAGLVAAAVATDTSEGAADTYRPGFGDRACWFSRRRALMVFFAIPLTIIMVLNVLLFIGSALIVRQAAKSAASITCAPSKTNLKLYCRLAVMTGLSWVLGLAAGWVDFPPLWHAFVVLNTLQGVFIFVSFTMGDRLRGKARRQVSRLARWRAGRGQEGADTGSDGGPPAPPTEDTQI